MEVGQAIIILMKNQGILPIPLPKDLLQSSSQVVPVGRPIPPIPALMSLLRTDMVTIEV
jgi:hypothetical protein